MCRDQMSSLRKYVIDESVCPWIAEGLVDSSNQNKIVEDMLEHLWYLNIIKTRFFELPRLMYTLSLPLIVTLAK
jgi:hypothetical protein